MRELPYCILYGTEYRNGIKPPFEISDGENYNDLPKDVKTHHALKCLINNITRYGVLKKWIKKTLYNCTAFFSFNYWVYLEPPPLVPEVVPLPFV